MNIKLLKMAKLFFLSFVLLVFTRPLSCDLIGCVIYIKKKKRLTSLSAFVMS